MLRFRLVIADKYHKLKLHAKLAILFGMLGQASAQRTSSSAIAPPPKGTTTSVWLIQGGALTSIPPTLTASVGGSSIARTYVIGPPTTRPASEGHRVGWWDRISVDGIALTEWSDVLYGVRKSGRLTHGDQGEERGKVDLTLEVRCSLDTSRSACSGSWSSTMGSRDDSTVTTSAARGTFTTTDSVINGLHSNRVLSYRNS